LEGLFAERATIRAQLRIPGAQVATLNDRPADQNEMILVAAWTVEVVSDEGFSQYPQKGAHCAREAPSCASTAR
jgi:hypothetical protein